ncbi:hypothetical protein H6F73_05110 [Microcoleus sp. FACHB-68]|nr:hypothetical protein [Microcoleus sp. FACHB-68]
MTGLVPTVRANLKAQQPQADTSITLSLLAPKLATLIEHRRFQGYSITAD